MEIGLLIVLMGVVIIAFCAISIFNVISGKIDGIIESKEKMGVSIFLLICFFIGYSLLRGGVKLINM